MAWLFIVCAALVDVTWVTLLKVFGSSRSWCLPLAMGMSASIPFVLHHALKTLPSGTAYSTLGGIATVGVALAGIFLLHESASWPRLLFISLIVVGVVGLRLIENPAG